MRAALFSYVWRRGEQCHRVDDHPGESCSVMASWRVLCPNRSGFEGGGIEVGCPAATRGPARGCRQRASVRSTGAGMATSRPRALQQRRECRCSARRGAVGAGMAAQD
jgi:hypothetical protein